MKQPLLLADRLPEWWKLIEDADARQKYYTAVLLLRRIAYNADDPAPVERAKARLAAYRADPAIAKIIDDEDLRHNCESLMSLGRTYAMNGLLSGAVIQYQKLVDLYPGTPHVEEAQKQIEALQARIKEHDE